MEIPRHSLVGLLVVVALFVSGYFVAQRKEPDAADPPSASADVSRVESTATTSAEFPGAELRSALTDVCSNAGTDSANKEWTQEEIQSRIDAFNEQKHRYCGLGAAALWGLREDVRGAVGAERGVGLRLPCVRRTGGESGQD